MPAIVPSQPLAPTPPAVRYRIAPVDPNAHLFEVACTVADPDPGGQRFRLPVWIPGSYLVREFARHFVTVRAESAGNAVALAKESKDTWRAAPCAGPLTVTARVYAYDLSVRTAYLDATRGYFNGPSVFLCPDGRADRGCEVEIAPPAGPAFAAWRVATTLPSAGAAEAGFGAYRAANYDELIDHPVEMSDFAVARFTAGGVPHDIAVSGRQRSDLDRFARDLARICQWQCDLFGGAAGAAAPFDRYLFQIAAVGDGYGGLEHRASTSLVCRRDELPQPGAAGIDDAYLNLLGLASHEYFHSWNVKRIKPAAFAPYDLARENYTRQLWVFEGFTSYYDDLALVRSGVIDAKRYLQLLGRTITTVLRTPGRHAQSVAESSFDAWIKYYRQDENTPNAVVSYYTKGALVALALDLQLRRRGGSLDRLMRTLWERHGRTGNGVPEGAVEALACELGGPELADFFARCVHGTEDPPLAALLAEFGVAFHLRPAEGGADRGGTPGKARDGATHEGATHEAATDEGAARAPAPQRSWLGGKFASGHQPRLVHVFAGGPLQQAGLSAHDTIVAVDGLRASADALDRLVTRRAPGDSFEVHAFRRDELFTARVTLAAAPLDTCWLALADAADPDTTSRRDAWLGSARS